MVRVLLWVLGSLISGWLRVGWVTARQLKPAVGIHRADGFNHAAQAVGAEQVHIQNSPGLEVIQHIQPEFAALMCPNPHTMDVLPTIHG